MKRILNREMDLLQEFQLFIIASGKGKRVKKDGTKITDGSVRKLASTYHLLKTFSEKKNFCLRIKLLSRNTREIKAEKN
ncbi:MAG TPA: hypothetical protein VFU62_00585, partial [Hanamia sp.]|nr:hypothetical protein [Hanamia sp.]